MSEPIKIVTSKYNKDGQVDIDGHIWTVKLPGAATELRLNQAQRRLQVIQKKIDKGDATEEDLDRYDEYEKTVYDAFRLMLRDTTEDNSEVNAWIDETPLVVIMLVFEDMKAQANGNTESS